MPRAEGRLRPRRRNCRRRRSSAGPTRGHSLSGRQRDRAAAAGGPGGGDRGAGVPGATRPRSMPRAAPRAGGWRRRGRRWPPASAPAPQDVVFTAGGTEANALAVQGLGRGRRVLVGATEHPAVLAAAPGAGVIPVLPDGTIDLAALAALLAEAGPALVCLMAANNETGVLHPLAEAAALCRAQGALLHVDAVQAAGRVALPAGCDMPGALRPQAGRPGRGRGAAAAAGAGRAGADRRRRPGTRPARRDRAAAGDRRPGRGGRGGAGRAAWRASPRCATGSRPGSPRWRRRRSSPAPGRRGCRIPAASSCPGRRPRPR